LKKEKTEMKNQQELDPIVKDKLNLLDPVQPRDSQAAERGRSRYLSEAKGMTVTFTGRERLTLWMNNFIQIFRRKERSPMLTTFISILLAFTALLGSGVTVVAAQSSQPNDWLYPLKTLSEDACYPLIPGDQNHFNLSLIYADRRMAEIQTSFENGEIPAQAVVERLHTHLQTAFELSVKNMADAENLLEQIQLRLEEHLRSRLQNTQMDPQGETIRLQIRNMLQERINWATAGAEQVALLRQQTQNQQQTQSQQQNQSGQSTQNAPGAQTQQQNQQENQQQFAWQATPLAQNQYGAGNDGGGGNGFGDWNFPWDATLTFTPTPAPMGYQYHQGGGGQGR
jgi:hypothetical protein